MAGNIRYYRVISIGEAAIWPGERAADPRRRFAPSRTQAGGPVPTAAGLPTSRDVRRRFKQVSVDEPPPLFKVDQSKLIGPSRAAATPRNAHLRPVPVKLNGGLIDHARAARRARDWGSSDT